MVSLSFMFILLDWAIRLTVEAYSCRKYTINSNHPDEVMTLLEKTGLNIQNSLTEGSLRTNWLSNS